MAQNWTIDPKSGDYVMGADGAPLQTDSLNTPAYIRLKTPRLGWLYAPDTSYGSDFKTIKNVKSYTRNTSLIENTAAVALQPIVDDGRASTISVSTTATQRGQQNLEVDITQRAAKLEQLGILTLGV